MHFEPQTAAQKTALYIVAILAVVGLGLMLSPLPIGRDIASLVTWMTMFN